MVLQSHKTKEVWDMYIFACCPCGVVISTLNFICTNFLENSSRTGISVYILEGFKLNQCDVYVYIYIYR